MSKTEAQQNAALVEVLKNSPRGWIPFFRKKRNAQELAKAVGGLLNPLDPDSLPADPNFETKDGKSILIIASSFKNKDYSEVIKILLQHRSIRPDACLDPIKHRTAFLINVENGNLENVKSFLDPKIIAQDKFNINAVDFQRKSALMIAAEEGDLEMVKLLIERGGSRINFMLNDYSEKTALDIVKASMVATQIREEIEKLIVEGIQKQIG